MLRPRNFLGKELFGPISDKSESVPKAFTHDVEAKNLNTENSRLLE
jgi:hypothetical protein